MGLEDREWWKDAQRERIRRGESLNQTQKPNPAPPDYFERLTAWGPFRIGVFWVVVSASLYVAIGYYMKPKSLTVSASGNLVIPRARDGNFYASGTISGKPVTFLVDTGASLVTVSEQFAHEAGLEAGAPTVFKTVNGDLAGRVVSDIPITIGPVAVSGIRVGIGFVGHDTGDALLGQNFLSKFDVVLSKEQMSLQGR